MGDWFTKRKYQKLCSKAITQELTALESETFERWLAASAQNKNNYQKIKKAWQEAEPLVISDIPDPGTEWKHLETMLSQSGIEMDRQPVVRKAKPGRGFSLPALRPMAYGFAVVILAVGFLLWRGLPQPSELMEAVTHNSERTQIELDDGTQVSVNSGSKIRYEIPFSKQLREVYLEGEAFFEVHPESRPFVVVTENSRTTVLGTKFNVWSRGSQTRVIVMSGCVKVESSHEQAGILLTEDQMSRVSGEASPIAAQHVDADYLLGWLKGWLVFQQTPLTEIIEELERTYDVIIETESPELSSRTLTASFEYSSPETVLSSICLTMDSVFRFENGKYIILE